MPKERIVINLPEEQIANLINGKPCPNSNCDGKLQLIVCPDGYIVSCYTCRTAVDLNEEIVLKKT